MSWYKGTGNESGIVLSTRVRLARNSSDFPFPVRLGVKEKEQVCLAVKEALCDYEDDKLQYINMSALTPSEAVSLAEKHLISPEFAYERDGRALMLSENEDISIMLCEEDHVRIQVIFPGLALSEAYEKADKIDSVLEKKLNYAYKEPIGYLTQCPTNLGTGMRASVLLHLPALTGKGAMRRLSATVAKLGLTLRGSFGESGDGTGDIYQLSNQVTLGISENAALQNLSSIAMQIVTQEKQARALLVKDEDFIDKVYRSWGILRSAYKLTSQELMSLISYVSVGACEGIIDVPCDRLITAVIELQPASLSVAENKKLTQSQRDILRAQRVRELLE